MINYFYILLAILIIFLTPLLIRYPKTNHQWANVTLSVMQVNDFTDQSKRTKIFAILTDSQAYLRKTPYFIPKGEYVITKKDSENEILIILDHIQEGGYSKISDIDSGKSFQHAEVEIDLKSLEQNPIYLIVKAKGYSQSGKFRFEIKNDQIICAELETASFITNHVTDASIMPKRLVRIIWPRDLVDTSSIAKLLKLDQINIYLNKSEYFVENPTLDQRTVWKTILPYDIFSEGSKNSSVEGYSDESLEKIDQKITESFPELKSKINLTEYNISGKTKVYP